MIRFDIFVTCLLTFGCLFLRKLRRNWVQLFPARTVVPASLPLAFFPVTEYFEAINLQFLTVAKDEIHVINKMPISILKLLRTKWYLVKVLPKRFSLNANTVGFRAQI